MKHTHFPATTAYYVVLAYRPKPKTKAAKKRVRNAKRATKSA